MAFHDAPLPDILGAAPPEHDLRGRILVLLVHGLALALFGAALAAIAGDRRSPGMIAASAVLAAIGCAAVSYLAEGLRRFECWAWFFAMSWLLVPVPGLAGVVLLESRSLTERLGGAAAVMTLLGAMHYLWHGRWDFWMDARLERLRPPPRGVTLGWRAARLGRMATGPATLRPAGPRPGELWMRRTSPGG